jgi:hypothetical protein
MGRFFVKITPRTRVPGFLPVEVRGAFFQLLNLPQLPGLRHGAHVLSFPLHARPAVILNPSPKDSSRMSTIVCLKENNTLVLATDSIAYDARRTRVLSNTERKIFEFTPGAFYAAVGFCNLAGAQVRILTALARSAGTMNLRALADLLDSASWPLLEQLAKGPHAEQLQDEAGVKRLHSYILVGLNEGVPGYLYREFSIGNDGTVQREEQQDFRPSIAGGIITPGYLATDLNLAEIWADGLIPTAERVIDHLRRVTPFVGGPSQMVCITPSGAQWIHQPLENDATEKVAPNLGSGVWINPVTKQIEPKDLDIQKFASSIRPVAIFTTNPALPDPNYPNGTFGKNVTTGAFLRVNTAGNAWEPAVKGGTDIQANSITVDRLDAASISTAFASITYLTANYITASAIAAAYVTTSYLSANYATITQLNAKTITADRITGGTCTATVSFTAPQLTITAGAFAVYIDPTNQVKVSSISGTPFQAQLGGGVSSGFGTQNGLAMSSGIGGASQAVYTADGMIVKYGSGTVSLGSGGFGISAGGLSVGADNTGFLVNGSYVVKARSSTSPTTLADVIAILRYHGLCN